MLGTREGQPSTRALKRAPRNRAAISEALLRALLHFTTKGPLVGFCSRARVERVPPVSIDDVPDLVRHALVAEHSGRRHEHSKSRRARPYGGSRSRDC
jgi:uncharacterized protein YbjT (DUF2867 family)